MLSFQKESPLSWKKNSELRFGETRSTKLSVLYNEFEFELSLSLDSQCKTKRNSFYHVKLGQK